MAADPDQTRPIAADGGRAYRMAADLEDADDLEAIPPTDDELAVGRAAVWILEYRRAARLELRRAARAVVAGWDDGDDVDPDRLDDLIARLAAALAALEADAGVDT
jgi:hypothetical protein